jgi:hypothetical protein
VYRSGIYCYPAWLYKTTDMYPLDEGVLMTKDFTELNGVINVQVMQERDATIVTLRTEYATVKGSARRDPQDKHDPEVAYALAVSRALEKLATRYRKRAQGRMNTLENNRKQAEAAALKKTRTEAAVQEAQQQYGADWYKTEGRPPRTFRKTRTEAAVQEAASFGRAFQATTFYGGNAVEGGFPRSEAGSRGAAGQSVTVGEIEAVLAAPPLKVVAEYELSDGRVLTVYRDGSTKLSGAPQS